MQDCKIGGASVQGGASPTPMRLPEPGPTKPLLARGCPDLGGVAPAAAAAADDSTVRLLLAGEPTLEPVHATSAPAPRLLACSGSRPAPTASTVLLDGAAAAAAAAEAVAEAEAASAAKRLSREPARSEGSGWELAKEGGGCCFCSWWLRASSVSEPRAGEVAAANDDEVVEAVEGAKGAESGCAGAWALGWKRG
ncbi:hypothetical protein TSOC_009141 [Tetrabaena socialis]|uniref:Uncharacterized protein n=1 Tax=Tetrabaena socialis TaxID=47790 RepID=A0A2J7ZWN0_9CHLO|nr:hypothetical protein TSOC_009141 [Tetrabaena socialis]|eukprot:PNH04680.1 hypothetical protein TSOC_009141 [Tetrabaena socialis]